NVMNTTPDYNYCHTGTYSFSGAAYYIQTGGVDNAGKPMGNVVATQTIPASGLPIFSVGNTAGVTASGSLLSNNYLSLTQSAGAAGMSLDASANTAGSVLLTPGSTGIVRLGAAATPLTVGAISGKLIMTGGGNLP